MPSSFIRAQNVPAFLRRKIVQHAAGHDRADFGHDAGFLFVLALAPGGKSRLEQPPRRRFGFLLSTLFFS